MGRPSRISRQQIIVSALELCDERGLSSLTMTALARSLEVTPMALYRHVANKAELLDGLVEQLLAEILSPPGDLPPDERLSGFAHGLRAAAGRHPTVFPLLVQRPAVTVTARQARDAITQALVDAGVEKAHAAQLQRVLSSAILGFVLSETSGRFELLSQKERDTEFELLLGLLKTAISSTTRG